MKKNTFSTHQIKKYLNENNFLIIKKIKKEKKINHEVLNAKNLLSI